MYIASLGRPTAGLADLSYAHQAIGSRSLFRQVDIPTGRYSDKQVDIPTGLYSDRSIGRQVGNPTGRYSDIKIIVKERINSYCRDE